MLRLPRTCLLFVSLFSVATSAHAFEFKEGQWELVVKQSLKGMPTGMPVTRWRECLHQSDPIPKAFLQARSCEVVDQHTVYRTLKYKLSCYGDNGTFVTEGKIRFGDFKLTGKARSDLGEVGGRSMVTRYKFEGRRIGDCQ
jgi:hypothetical protein